MKCVIAALLLLGSLCPAQPLAEQEVMIRWATFRYRVDEGFLRAVLRYENGCKGYAAGFNSIQRPDEKGSDAASYADPTMPDGAIQQCRVSRRIIAEAQSFIFSDPERRRQFSVWWAQHYHCDTKTCNDTTYAQELRKVWTEEREYVRRRDAAGEYQPFTPSASESPSR